MLYFPFIYFSILFLFFYKKRGFDACTFITSLYVITSFCAVLMDVLDLIPIERSSPSIFAVLVYCLLLTFIILPVSKFDSGSLRNIVVRHPRAVNCLVIFFFSYFLFKLIFYSPDIAFKIAYGDWEQLRKMQLNDGMFTIVQFSGIMKYIDLMFAVFGSISFVMFPIFFVSICFQKKSWIYSLMCFFSSTTVIMDGIIGIDRSQSFRWLLFLALNMVIFWKHISKKAKRVIAPVIGGVIVVVFIYLTSITVSRFENSNDGINNNLVSYAGQSPITFCYLFDHFDNREGISTKYLFPATHYWVFKDYFGNVTRQEELTAKSGIECGAFYSVLGTFLLDANQIGPFLFVILYLIVASACLRGVHKGNMTLWTFMVNYLLMLIPTFGIIAYPYTSPYTSLSIVVLIIGHVLLNVWNSIVTSIKLASRKKIAYAKDNSDLYSSGR